jgi:hypothetical protein
MGKYKKDLLQNTALPIVFAVLFWVTLLTSGDSLSASTPSPSQSNLTTITPQQQSKIFSLNTTYTSPSQSNLTTITPQQQSQVPQQNQQALSPPQPPQISWNELEEAEGFIANGKIDSIIYTINGKWTAIGDWMMRVSDGELSSFNTTMNWYNGTSSHSHEFLNFETTDDDVVDISAEDQTISIAGTMDIGTNGVISWQEIPSEILIEAGRIITISLDDEGTNGHFGGQSVHGNVTSLSICSTAPGPAMQIPPGC